MDQFTLILIVIGVLVVAIIGVASALINRKHRLNLGDFSFHQDQKNDVLVNSDEDKNNAEDLDGLRALKNNDEELPEHFSTQEEAPKQSKSAEENIEMQFAEQSLPKGMEQLIISMIIQRDNDRIGGNEVFNACKSIGFQFGFMDIFHFPLDDNPELVMFSLSDMVEPGTFDMERVASLSFTGLMMFIQLPLPGNQSERYECFLQKGQELANALNANLYDEKRNKLTAQIISHNKERVRNYQHQLLKLEKSEQH